MRAVMVLLFKLFLLMGANFAIADNALITTLKTLKIGDMRKLVFHAKAEKVSDRPFLDDNNNEILLANYEGKYLLVNFWATWCVPCRIEMPSLSSAQNELGNKKFKVITIATGRNSVENINKFFLETNILNLTKFRDQKNRLAQDMAVVGLPTTILISPDGEEVARLLGDANWASDEALKILKTWVHYKK